VQEALFKEGYCWCGNGTTVQYLEQPYLFMDNDKYLGYSTDIIYFKQSGGKEVSYREIIGEEAEPISEGTTEAAIPVHVELRMRV
jgi:hypothetical protein